jgi:DNA-binding IclR family transcriptional regulator
MAGTEKVLLALGLFSAEHPIWTVEEGAAALGASLSSAYRYFAQLSEAGLVTTVSTGRYTLGPSIIELDRQIQLTDPLLLAARPVMQQIIAYAPARTVVLLCRSYGDRVLCVHNVFGDGPQELISYERGRPMPLFRGATSKAILAHLDHRTLKRLYEAHPDEIAAAGLGASLAEFRAALASLRKGAAVVTLHEIDPGRMGIAAPILKDDRQPLGSLSFVVQENAADASAIRLLSAVVLAAAADIEAALRTPQADPAVGQTRA